MKILYLTNLVPCPEKPVGGIFTYKRIEAIRKFHPDVELKIIFPDSVLRKPFPFIHLNSDYNFSQMGLIDCDVRVARYLEYLDSGIRFLATKVIEYRKRYNYDLIHVHWAYPFAYAAKLITEATGIPYIVTCQGSDIHQLMLREKRRNLIVKGLHAARKVVFVSEYLHRFAVEHGYTGTNFQVITNGFDPEVFFPAEGREAFNNDYPVIGYISDFSMVKGGDLVPGIVNSIDQSLGGKVNFMFILKSNAGIYPENLIKVEKARVLIRRSVPYQDMGKCYADMDLLLMPSRNEGWACTAIESLSCGVPVLASGIAPLREVIPEPFGRFIDLQGGEAAVFEAFSKGAAELLQNDFDVQAMQEYCSKFCWENIVRSEVELYHEALK